LQALHQKYRAACTGIEPSKMAVKAGSSTFKEITLKIGTADKLNFAKDSFDCVIVGFCLYLCDRQDLFVIAAEIDKILCDSGILIIYDFSPPFPYKNNYTHYSGISSYKMDYSAMFFWNPEYSVIYKRIFSHNKESNLPKPDDRVGVTILQKNREWSYSAKPW
jgi:ubiquinone/menaquinone biosynthesis C-methylase UbiE